MILEEETRLEGQGSKIGPCQVFPSDNVWNTPIDQLPVDAQSQQYIASMGASHGLHPDFGSGSWEGSPIGMFYMMVNDGTPKVPMTFDYADESDTGAYPIPDNPLIEGGTQSNGDRHILVVDTSQCILYETWSTYPGPHGGWQAGSGAIFDLKSNDLRPDTWTSADAAGLPVLPGLVRYEEIEQGVINHAIRFTVDVTQKAHIWPARHDASSYTSPSVPPMGVRVRLKADFDTTGFSPTLQIFIKAMQTYGMILADNGSNWYVSGVHDIRWDDNELVEGFKKIHGSDFEVVDESALQVSANSGQAK